ncbi:MAG: HD domain-containing protein [Thermoleophilaceae bacterium]|nr:HD domain-containing protein [Thermoleophilaceae bacterium]
MTTLLAKPPGERHAQPAPAAEEVKTRSTWRYLPHALAVTLGTVAAPLASVELVQILTGETSIILSLVVAGALSVAVASAGSWLWQRRPESRDILFGDLMLWSWARRLRTERRLRRTRDLLEGAAARDQEHQIEILERLAQALDARDPYTHGHSQRVARNAHMIARRMGLPDDEVARIRVAAAVHDAGKLEIDRAVLNKPGALTDDEFELIKEHPVRGAALLEALEEPEIVAMVRHHHERLDGSGYPDGLAGDEIPLGARIIAVADTFDAITSVRPYRRPRKQQAALKILKEEAGTRLDAHAVGVFLAYYTARRTAAWSSVLVAVPERIIGMLSGGAGPIAQGAVATVAAASVGGALVHPALDTQSQANSRPAALVRSAGTPGSPVGTDTPETGRKAAARVTTRSERAAGRRTTAGPGATTSPGEGSAPKAGTVSEPRTADTPPRVSEGGADAKPDPAAGGDNGNAYGRDRPSPGGDTTVKAPPGNSGQGNSGPGNSGQGNSGQGNSGQANSGQGNSGSGSSGSSGSESSGSGSSGSGSSGTGGSSGSSGRSGKGG